MEWINKHHILIVGLGLIGGSYAKALRRMGYHVSAITRNPKTIGYALANGLIDEGCAFPDPELIGRADAVVFALYPNVFKEWIRDYQQYFKSGIRITDVTGVKVEVVYEIQEMLRDDVEFIASHPMAGREVSGVTNSDDRIFRDANFLVVPTEKNTEAAVEWCMTLGRILGFTHVSVLTPAEHDQMIGYVSQLTHCIAIALMTANDNPHLADYTGDSFRDLTRIARINDEMWSELFLMNRENLMEEIDQFTNSLNELRAALENNDRESLRSAMRLSTERRSWFDRR